eukprot:UN05185
MYWQELQKHYYFHRYQDIIFVQNTQCFGLLPDVCFDLQQYHQLPISIHPNDELYLSSSAQNNNNEHSNNNNH